jgi:hypothetical protein
VFFDPPGDPVLFLPAPYPSPIDPFNSGFGNTFDGISWLSSMVTVGHDAC